MERVVLLYSIRELKYGIMVVINKKARGGERWI